MDVERNARRSRGLERAYVLPLASTYDSPAVYGIATEKCAAERGGLFLAAAGRRFYRSTSSSTAFDKFIFDVIARERMSMTQRLIAFDIIASPASFSHIEYRHDIILLHIRILPSSPLPDFRLLPVYYCT